MRGLSRGLVATLAWGALTAGARYPWAYWPLAIACVGLGFQAAWGSRAWRDPSARGLAWAFASIAAAIALQIVPLPHAWLLRLSPAVDSFLQQYTLGYAVNPPAMQTLSIDPAITTTTLALFVAFATFTWGLSVGLGYVSIERLVSRLTALGVVLAVIGVVQRAAIGASPLVYGFWQPQAGGAPFGSFFNRNHFAGWMVMALPVVLGYACAVLDRSDHPGHASTATWLRWGATPEASRFMFVGFSVLAMATALVATGSRSGIASFSLAVVVFGALASRRLSGSAGRRVAVVGLVGLVLGAIVWSGAQAIVARFSLVSSDLPGRVSAWRDTMHIARDFPIFGSGLGTYGAAMIVYQTGSRIPMFVQAHNDYLQLAAEGGLLVGLPALVAIVTIARCAARRVAATEDDAVRAWVRAGAIAGLVGIAAQSVVEYSLQRPGNTALCAMLMALAVHRPPRASRTYAHRV